jgi:DNA-binding GntR family transcriptional regulator
MTGGSEPSGPPSRAADRAYNDLRSGILLGTYAPGSRLGELDLAEAVGVSRTPIREALSRLAADGLVELLPNRGARVSRWSTEGLRELYEIRGVLESFAAQKACANAITEDLEQLTALCDEMEEAAASGEMVQLADLNGSFHDRILELAGNERLSAMIRSVRQLPLVVRTFHDYDVEALARSMSHHREIVAAIRARDTEWAAAVMRSHIHAARDVLLASGS